uniref:Uncharacterized protein n=1 Tax=Caenorhabditis japonica TaxID=281687 RepID=A0A8R1IVX9_CAEJA
MKIRRIREIARRIERNDEARLEKMRKNDGKDRFRVQRIAEDELDLNIYNMTLARFFSHEKTENLLVHLEALA